MKTILIILSLLLLGGVALLFVLGVVSRSGSPPGLVQGQLAQCPDSPNCVCSEFPDDDTHTIAPIDLPESAQDQMQDRLKAAIRAMGGRIQVEHKGYLAATFSSRLFGFVDDLELRFDPPRGVVQVRSASRVGYGDFGVNRKRVEALRRQISERMPSTP